MRLGDLDALKDSLLKKARSYAVSMFDTSAECCSAKLVALECAEEAKNALTIDPLDALGVCRCKDCKYYKSETHHCNFHDVIIGPYNYCSIGERREDTHG